MYYDEHGNLQPGSCRWLNIALGIGGIQGCFWTDLVRCEQDCSQPPLIAADSTRPTAVLIAG